MYLRTAYAIACQPNSRHAFEFAPPTGSVSFADIRQPAYAAARSDRFDVANLAENLEVHSL
jgi:hypothetical protein